MDTGFHGSYRTYEEWKLLYRMIIDHGGGYGSYRTYEEWKLTTPSSGSGRFICSYRTYEEWKLRYSEFEYVGSARFLPYLWGMETVIALLIGKMERGFLPYLWGMETTQALSFTISNVSVLTVPMRNGNYRLHARLQVLVGSYRTYEEWKHSLQGKGKILNFGSYRTYEEWKLILPTPPLHG